MPRSMKESIVEVIRSFPDVVFIWKYEDPEDDVGAGVENLVKTAWMPQNDLLSAFHIVFTNFTDI